MKIIAIIPARYKSTRFPGKPLVNIAGKSMIQRVWEQAAMAMPANDIYVATESAIIQEHCVSFGAQVLMTSDGCLTGTDRIYEASKQVDSDIYINIQGDEPLIDPKDIIKIKDQALLHPNRILCGMCDLTSELDYKRNTIPKVVTDLNNNLMYMSRSAIPGNKSETFISGKKQVCVYAFPKNALQKFGESPRKTPLEELEDIEILRFLEYGIPVKMVELSQSSIAVDVKSDVELVERTLKSFE